ncbi:MAG: ABC transporter ATP-binding protein [Pedococcus sp.]
MARSLREGEARGAEAPAVRLEGLTKRYGPHRGVESLTLDVPRGQVLGFLGPNGAGKSTTIRLIMGLSRPHAGSVEVLGGSPREVALRRRVGYLPGDLMLFPALTARDLVARVARIHGGVPDRDVEELASRLSAELDRPMRALSKGNRQKIGVVLAFMHRPELLVLDEPTSGLDPLLQDEFAQLVRERVHDGATVFLSSHDLDEVERVVDRVAIIRDGRLVAVDTVNSLRERAPRVVQLHFDKAPASAALAAIPGVRVMDAWEETMRLEVVGPMAPLLRAIGTLGVTDLVAKPAGLDEIFRAFYRGTDGQEGHRAS